MRNEGLDLERMMNDQSEDWSPHPFPDGKSILYLSIAAGTEGNMHNKYLELQFFLIKDSNSLRSLCLYCSQRNVMFPAGTSKERNLLSWTHCNTPEYLKQPLTESF